MTEKQLVCSCLTALAVAMVLSTNACTKKSRPVAAPETLAVDPKFCEKNPDVCERLCAACADKKQCFAAGGECGGALAAAGDLQDQNDRGGDIWLPGCHYHYQVAGCTNGKPLMADFCHSDGVTIEEWFEQKCHIPIGDHYSDNCDKKCKLLGLGAGKCTTVKAFCPGGIDSAFCECEKGQPDTSPKN